jgi:hypothetical protein
MLLARPFRWPGLHLPASYSLSLLPQLTTPLLMGKERDCTHTRTSTHAASLATVPHFGLLSYDNSLEGAEQPRLVQVQYSAFVRSYCSSYCSSINARRCLSTRRHPIPAPQWEAPRPIFPEQEPFPAAPESLRACSGRGSLRPLCRERARAAVHRFRFSGSPTQGGISDAAHPRAYVGIIGEKCIGKTACCGGCHSDDTHVL